MLMNTTQASDISVVFMPLFFSLHPVLSSLSLSFHTFDGFTVSKSKIHFSLPLIQCFLIRFIFLWLHNFFHHVDNKLVSVITSVQRHLDYFHFFMLKRNIAVRIHLSYFQCVRLCCKPVKIRRIYMHKKTSAF